jgi:AhpC/TSA family
MRQSLFLVLALGAFGCGSNTPTLPADLRSTGDMNGDCSAPQYPSGPFGTEVGDTVANLCFQGFWDATRVPHDAASLETVAFSDYYDPLGARGIELILLDTAAVWCAACRVEHEDLAARTTDFAPRGLRIVSTLFQDNARNPASLRDLSTWVETFQSNYAMLLDPDYQMGAYASAETAPLNLVIDARTMKIEQKLLGDQAAVLWPFITSELDRRNAE